MLSHALVTIVLAVGFAGFRWTESSGPDIKVRGADALINREQEIDLAL